jgi:FecR protein
VKRRNFIALLSWAAAGWPVVARAQYQAPPAPGPANPAPVSASDTSIGQVATLQGGATVTRGNAAAIPLQVADPVYEKDVLQTALSASLGVTFDDQTTFSLSANTRIVVDEFVYHQGGTGNAATFSVAAGTAAFVASLVAKTGDMKITTDTATIGIRGTTGVVEVPSAGGTAAPTIKLYPDSDGHVGQIEVFDRQGGRLGTLTQGASAFTLRPGPGGRLAAFPYQIPPQEAARDRGVLQRLNASHAIGRQMTIQRRQQRGRNQRGPNNPRPPGGARQPFNRGGPGQQRFREPGNNSKERR